MWITKKTWKRTSPNGKCATTADIAHTALFLFLEFVRLENLRISQKKTFYKCKVFPVTGVDV